MTEINNIRSVLGQYEKTLNDKIAIERTCLNEKLKEDAYYDLQLRIIELKQSLLDLIQDLPTIARTSSTIVNKQEQTNNKTAIKLNKQETQIDVGKRKWKDSVGERVRFIYERSPEYLDSKEILNEIYEKMTNVYGIVWEQDYKEWKWNKTGIPNRIDIVYENDQYKSIFDAILDDRCAAVEERPKLTIKDLISPLLNKNCDPSKGGCVTLRNLYTHMAKKYNVKWDRMKKKYEKETGNILKSKSELLMYESGLMDRFRWAIHDFMTEEGGKNEER